MQERSKINSLLSFVFCGICLLVPINAKSENVLNYNIILFENFNQNELSSFAQVLLAKNNIELSQGNGPDGSNAIRVSYVGYKRGSKRAIVHYPLNILSEEAILSFDVLFDDDFQWVLGGKLHGLGPQNIISGGKKRQPDGWSARVLFKKNGECATYIYDQVSKRKYGIKKKSNIPAFKKGQWHHVRFYLKLNDPNYSNGYARIIIDNKLVVNHENLVLRSIGGDETLIQTFMFSTFHGGHKPKWSPVDNNGEYTTVYAYFDNFKIINK